MNRIRASVAGVRPPPITLILSASDNEKGDILTQDLHLYAREKESLAPDAPLVAHTLKLRNMGKSISGEYKDFDVLSSPAASLGLLTAAGVVPSPKGAELEGCFLPVLKEKEKTTFCLLTLSLTLSLTLYSAVALTQTLHTLTLTITATRPIGFRGHSKASSRKHHCTPFPRGNK